MYGDHQVLHVLTHSFPTRRSSDLEGAGERFEGVLPPVSLAPCFSIRKPAARIYTLLDYVKDGIMSADTARLLSMAVVERRGIEARVRQLEQIVEQSDLVEKFERRGVDRVAAEIAQEILVLQIGRAHV